MMFDPYDLWRYAHVLLFVYWLGADLGVFYTAKFVARSDLGLDERLRFLELTLLIDMGPRTGLILILPVGFQLSVMTGLIEMNGGQLALVWILSVIWLAAMWRVYLDRHRRSGVVSRRIDMWFRYAVIAAMAPLGIMSLLNDGPILAPWLALKAVLFAVVVAIGIYLRTVISAWKNGFQMLAEQQDLDEANRLIADAGRKGETAALWLWALLLALAFLGVVKPM